MVFFTVQCTTLYTYIFPCQTACMPRIFFLRTHLKYRPEGDGLTAIGGLCLRHKVPHLPWVCPLVNPKGSLLCFHDSQLSSCSQVFHLEENNNNDVIKINKLLKSICFSALLIGILLALPCCGNSQLSVGPCPVTKKKG